VKLIRLKYIHAYIYSFFVPSLQKTRTTRHYGGDDAAYSIRMIKSWTILHVKITSFQATFECFYGVKRSDKLGKSIQCPWSGNRERSHTDIEFDVNVKEIIIFIYSS